MSDTPDFKSIAEYNAWHPNAKRATVRFFQQKFVFACDLLLFENSEFYCSTK
jgi:hypothetical protein